jgi:DNA-binding CsgD family transcriptional regulator
MRQRTTGKGDVIGLIEQGYLPRVDRAAWLRGITPLFRPFLDPDQIALISYFLPPSELPFLSVGPNCRVPSEEFKQAFMQAIASRPPEQVERVMRAARTPGLYTITEALGELPVNPLHDRITLVDSPGVVVHTADGPPAVIAGYVSDPFPIDSSLRALWRRIAVHLGAGCRLSGRPSSTDAQDVESVVSPDGRVLDASKPLAGTTARERLRAAVRAVDRARTRRGRADPEAALELWRGLFSGRWSLVDHFDSDGKRFLLARRNDPDAPGPPPLPLRQRQILFYVGAGWSNKEVGYALGLSSSTVAVHLHRALRSLRLASRADWIKLSSEVAGAMAAPEAPT